MQRWVNLWDLELFVIALSVLNATTVLVLTQFVVFRVNFSLKYPNILKIENFTNKAVFAS